VRWSASATACWSSRLRVSPGDESVAGAAIVLVGDSFNIHLFVVQRVGSTSPVGNTVGEPQLDFTFGRFNRVRSVHNVLSNVNAEVSTNGSRRRVQGVGLKVLTSTVLGLVAYGSQHETSSLDNGLSLPNHANNRSTAHVCNQLGEEGFVLQVLVVFLELSLAWRHHLQSNQLVSALFKTRNDFSNEATLNSWIR